MTDDAPLLIQKLRLQRGWSQEQLADVAGLSVRTIQRIECGQTPSAESLKALAAVLEGFYIQVVEYALDGLRVFDKIPFLNGDWEKRVVERYLGRKL